MTSLITLRCVFAFIVREITTTYGRQPGGFLWAIAEPIAGIAILSFIFSLAFRAPTLGNNFVTFYATGLLPFLFYSDLTSKIAQSIKYSRQLLYYAKTSYLDAIIARLVLHTMVNTWVFIIVITFVNYKFHRSETLDLIPIANSLAMTVCLGIGVGTINCFLSTRYPVWDRIWSIINRPAFIVSGIFFTFESIPAAYGKYLWFNPLIHITGEMRNGFYSTYDAQYISSIYVYSVSLVCFVIGLFLIHINRSGLINNH